VVVVVEKEEGQHVVMKLAIRYAVVLIPLSPPASEGEYGYS